MAEQPDLALRPAITGSALLAALLAATGAPEARAQGCAVPVAHLVSLVGDVRVNGDAPAGDLPYIAVCPGDTVEVGQNSRAGAYLLSADTPLQLEEETLARFQPPDEPGSGFVDLARGAVYFLSEVRRTLTIRTPYVTAGVEGTEVYLRADRPSATERAGAGAELIVLEGRVDVTPGELSPALARQVAATGERLAVDAGGQVRRTALPAGPEAYAALRRVTVGELAWTLFYPDIMVAAEAQPFARVGQAARLLAAGRSGEAEAVLADIRDDAGREAALRDALRATMAFARKDAAAANALAERGRVAAPDAATPHLAMSYARQLDLDLDGAVTAAQAAAAAAPRAALPRARLAELRLMNGEVRAARRAAQAAVALGGGPLADLALGFAELAALRGRPAEAAFMRALKAEGANPLALLGLGLALIKRGDLDAGRRQIENAVAHDPSSSLLRSYLGKGYFEERRGTAAAKQFAIAKALDPADPTPWFYDAVKKQLDNRPVEALQDLERSIELNDNRAPFRSRSLLDEDAAARGVGLGRIYDDLGFRQLGVNEAARALATDPANSAAHRFLADLYRGGPRLEVARASEVLQAQMLGPISAEPLQPSLAFTGLDVVRRTGPAQASFNEFTPLFQRDGWRLSGTGLVGSHETVGEEIAAATVLGRTGISLGQFHYESDGFRDNNDIEHDIYNIFAQTAPREDLSFQLEYRRRETEQGDRALSFDPDSFDPNQREKVNQDVVRLGARFEPSPNSTFLLSLLASDRDEQERTSLDVPETVLPARTLRSRNKENAQGKQAEGQYIYRGADVRLVAGGGLSLVDRENPSVLTEEPPLFFGQTASEGKADEESYNGYGYGYLDGPAGTTWTVGLGYDREGLEQDSVDGLTPKLGVEWAARPWLRLRGAAFRSIKRSIVVDQTLEPTEVAGFAQFRDDDNATLADTYAIGFDAKLTGSLTLGASVSHRDLSGKLFGQDGGIDVDSINADEDVGQLFAYWTPTDRFAFSAELIRDAFRQTQQDASGEPTRVETWELPLGVRYFHPSGWFGVSTARFLRQDVQRQGDSLPTEGSDNALLVNVGIGRRFNNGRAVVSFEVANLLDQDFDYQDDSYRSAQLPASRFLPERTFVLRAGVSF